MKTPQSERHIPFCWMRQINCPANQSPGHKVKAVGVLDENQLCKKQLVVKSGLDPFTRFFTYATFRLYADVPVFDLAENMGCSVKFIEDHYGHVNRLKRANVLTKDFKDEGSKIMLFEV